MSKKVETAGVVVLYHPDKKVEQNILSYLPELKKLYAIDNSETAAAKAYLPKSQKIEYIFNGKNLGIAKALNMGVELAEKAGADWLLTMDQDSKFEDGGVKKMVQYLAENDTEKIGILAPYQMIKFKTEKDVPKEEVTEMDGIMTSGDMIKISAWKKVGGFKEWLFIDCVDGEFALNLRKHGYKILRLNTVILKHKLGEMRQKRFLFWQPKYSGHNYIRQYYITRNELYVAEMYGEDTRAVWRKNLKQIGLILLFGPDRIRKIRSVFRGRRDFKRGIKGEYRYE